MSFSYTKWIADILLTVEQYPNGFVLNPRGRYTPEEQAERRRAAYYLQRKNLVQLIQSPKKGNTRPIIVKPPVGSGYNPKNVYRGVYGDFRAMLRDMIDKRSFFSWVLTGHKIPLKFVRSGLETNEEIIASQLGVSQARVSQMLKEYAEEEAENIKLYSDLLKRQ